MTRIIGGSAGSLRLATPGPATRPTSDRVREALFSRLDAHGGFVNGVILDLCAGSGALGLEAASRGATHVVLVDNHKGALSVMRANCAVLQQALDPPPRLEVVPRTAQSFLEHAPTLSATGVFCDPPYGWNTAEVEQILTLLPPWLAEDAWVVLERSTRSPEPVWPEGFAPWERKKYGETVLYVASWTKGSQPPV